MWHRLTRSPVVRFDTKAGERSLDVLRWGLVPFLGQRPQGRLREHQRQGRRDGNPAGLREAFQRRRCLVPVDNFYEWKKTGARKQPYAIALADRGLMALAGL